LYVCCAKNENTKSLTGTALALRRVPRNVFDSDAEGVDTDSGGSQTTGNKQRGAKEARNGVQDITNLGKIL
jgi:hypothetical protein